MRSTWKDYIVELIYLVFTGLIVVAPALYNRYPLMYFDSGAYMEMAANLEPSFHRAFGYPFLMKITGFVVSNWPIVMLQGMLVSYLLSRVMMPFFAERDRRWFHFLAVVLLSFFTSLSWYAAQLMPDIFTLIAVLSLAVVIRGQGDSVRRKAFHTLLLGLSLLTHLSHIPMVLMLLVSLAFIHFFVERPDLKALLRKYMVSMAVLVTSFLVVCTFNAVHQHGFRLSLASNAFITASLGEMGILKMYLDENCENSSLSLCAIKDDLPLETYGYLWDPEGPVQKHELGWEGANQEFAPVVRDFMSKPRYLKWLVFASVKATFKQMAQIELGSGLQYAYGEGTPPYWPMKSHFKQELNEYLISVQNKGDKLPLEFFRVLNYISLMLSLLLIGWAIMNRKFSKELAFLFILFVLAYVFNAAITGVLANVYERLQCRLLPLIQLLGLIIALQIPKPYFLSGSTESK